MRSFSVTLQKKNLFFRHLSNSSVGRHPQYFQYFYATYSLLLRILFITVCNKYVKRVLSIFRTFRFSVSRECRHCREGNSSFDFRVRLRTPGLHLASNATGPVMSCIFRLISSLTISEKVMKRFLFCLTMKDEHEGHFGRNLWGRIHYHEWCIM